MKLAPMIMKRKDFSLDQNEAVTQNGLENISLTYFKLTDEIIPL